MVGPCLFILYIIDLFANPKLPLHFSLTPLPLGNHKSVLYVCESVSWINSFVSYFRFHT